MRAGVGAILFLASLASAQTPPPNIIGPNTSDSIVIPITNDPGSLVPLSNVHVVVTAPSYFVVTSSSSVTVLPGDTQNLVINYQMTNVPSDVTQFNVGLQVRMDSTGTDPDPTTYDTTVILTIDNIPPVITVNDDNTGAAGAKDVASSDPSVPTLGYSNLKGLSILAADFAPGATAANPIYGSGPGALEVWSGVPGDSAARRFGANITAYAAFHEYFSGDPGLDSLNLPEGPAYVVATDQAGNGSMAMFVVDRTSPTVVFEDSQGPIKDRDQTLGIGLSVSVADPPAGSTAGSGIGKFVIMNDDLGVPFYEDDTPRGARYLYTTSEISGSAGLPVGNYSLVVADRAGNAAAPVHFHVVNPPSITLLDNGFTGFGGAGTAGPMYDAFRGDNTSSPWYPSAVLPAYVSSGLKLIVTPGAGPVTSLTVKGPDGQAVPLTAVDAQNFTLGVVQPLNNKDVLSPGLYTVVAKDALGTTTAPFYVVRIDIVNPGATPVTCSQLMPTLYNADLSVSSTRDLAYFETFGSDARLTDHQSLSGKTATVSAHAFSILDIGDADGNMITVQVSASCDPGVPGVIVTPFPLFRTFFAPAAFPQTKPLGAGVTAENVTVNGALAVDLSVGALPAPPPPGRKAAGFNGLIYGVNFLGGGQGVGAPNVAPGPLIDLPFSLRVPVKTGLTPSQLGKLSISAIVPPQGGLPQFVTPAAAVYNNDGTASYAVGSLDAGRKYVLLAPEEPDPAVAGLCGMTVQSNAASDPGLNPQCANPDTDPALAADLSAAAAAGYQPGSQALHLPEGNFNSRVYLSAPNCKGSQFIELSDGKASVLATYNYADGGCTTGLVASHSYFMLMSSGAAFGGSSGGLAVGTDPQGRTWEVAAASGRGVFLEAFDQSGVLLSSASLPMALAAGGWNVGFSGNFVYAVGTALGPATQGTDVAVYKVSSSGALLKQTFVDGGAGGNDAALGATNGFWIAGAASKTNTASKLGLWHYDPATDLATLTTTYTGAGNFDAGYGVAVDAGGAVWVIGYSSNPASGADALDLALWKFDPTGTRLIGGPFTRPGYARTTSKLGAALTAAPGALHAAAARLNAAGDYDLAQLDFDLNGGLLAERLWRGAPGSNDVPRAVGVSPAGAIAVAGESDVNGAPALGVWLFDPVQGLPSARTAAGVGPATGLALGAQGQVIFSVASSTAPYPFSGGTALPGAVIPPPVPAAPPATTLVVGTPQLGAAALFIATTTPLGFTVSRPARTFFAVDGGAFALYAGTFTLAAPGPHAVRFYSVDAAGLAEVARSSAVFVDATAPVTSLQVLGGRQFAGPDASTFYASSDTRLVLISTDPAANGAASGVAFTQWQDGNGAFQTYLSSLAFAEGAHRLSYQSADNVANLEAPRSTNVWVDATPPVTAVSVGSPTFTAPDGTIYVATATPVAFAAADPALPSGQPGSGVSRIEVALDSAPFSPYAAPLTLAEGRHVIAYRAVDNVGNVEAAHSISLQADATPPVSALVIGAPQFQLPDVLLVSSRTPFAIAAADPVTNNVASGVKDTYYRVSDVSPSTTAFALYAASFTLAGGDVNKVIEFYSRDDVLNAEAVRSSAVLLDSTPPEIALLSPAACDSGICRVLKGRSPVLGTARDAHLAGYVLDYAPGQNATTGYALISSGTVAVSSGALGTWDASALSGWLTLRLTATDLVQNVSALTLNVFAGDPGELLRLGDHEMFDMPEGVAAGADGKIYVADRNNDRVAVFSSTGALLASFGKSKDEHGDRDDGRASTTTARLNKPSGVAADAAGNVYVADTNGDRVLKLSAAGQVLLSLGRFHHPAGVAVDAAGSIYVADTENRRVQVFGSTGAFRFQFDLPPVPARPDHDDADRDGDHDGDARSNLGKPFAVALDAAGNIYVADPKGGRALKYGATGQLLLTIPVAGDKPGSFGQPFGIAVSASGDCVLVSDRKNSRVLKFDFQGGRNLAFGAKGRVRDEAPGPSATVVFNKPMGLALDAAGNLLVADRNNDRVREFSLPTGRPPLVVPPPKPEGDHTARDVVDREDGGKVERRDRAAVDIPAGAVAQDLKVTVGAPSEGADDDSSRRRAVDDKRLKAASAPVEYGPEGAQFQTPVTLTLPYSPELAALQGVDESDLKVHYWNRDKGQWQDLDSVVDPKTRTVKAKTTHFSLYQVFSGTASAAALSPLAADPTFGFKTAYAFPNPAHNAVTIRVQPGQADSVSVRVYDQAGRLAHQSANFSGSTFDDGNGLGPQFTYDHVWDLSGVGSGVYSYAITATKAGQADIHRTGRLAVVK